MIYQLLYPFQTTIDTNSFSEALKLIFKKNKNFSNFVIRNSSEAMRGNIKYINSGNKTKLALNMYLIQLDHIPKYLITYNEVNGTNIHFVNNYFEITKDDLTNFKNKLKNLANASKASPAAGTVARTGPGGGFAPPSLSSRRSSLSDVSSVFSYTDRSDFSSDSSDDSNDLPPATFTTDRGFTLTEQKLPPADFSSSDEDKPQTAQQGTLQETLERVQQTLNEAKATSDILQSEVVPSAEEVEAEVRDAFSSALKNLQPPQLIQPPQIEPDYTLPIAFNDSNGSLQIVIQNLDISNKKIKFNRFYGPEEQDLDQEVPLIITPDKYKFTFARPGVKFVDNFEFNQNFSEGDLVVTKDDTIMSTRKLNRHQY